MDNISLQGKEEGAVNNWTASWPIGDWHDHPDQSDITVFALASGQPLHLQ